MILVPKILDLVACVFRDLNLDLLVQTYPLRSLYLHNLISTLCIADKNIVIVFLKVENRKFLNAIISISWKLSNEKEEFVHLYD